MNFIAKFQPQQKISLGMNFLHKVEDGDTKLVS